MMLPQLIKENLLKSIFVSASSVIAIIGALFTIDARYAHAADVEKDKVRTERIITETSQNLRKQMLEDKVFELDIKKSQARDQKLSPVEQALRDRYQRQLDEINQSQSQARRPSN